MSKFKRQFVDGEYGQIHLRSLQPQTATKRPLVCLHMFPQSGRNFEQFLDAMEGDRIVIAPDFPGYGESDSPVEEITATDYARSVWQVIDSLGLLEQFSCVDLFGIHAGAKLATEVARQRPKQVNSLVLSSAAVLYPQELDELREAFFPVPLDKEGSRFKKLWAMLLRNQGRGQTYEMMATSFAEILRGGEKYEWGHHAVYEFNQVFPDVLASLPHPIALLNPKDDLYEMTTRTQRFIQNGELYDFPQWGQGFIEVNASEVANEVTRLLDELADKAKL